MRYPPPRTKVCKVFEPDTLGPDFAVGVRRFGILYGAFRRGGFVKSEDVAGICGDAKDGIPQGLKPKISRGIERPKAKALGYLDAKACWGTTLFFTLMMVCLWLTACAPPRPSRITIGAKNFTEQVVLGELLAQEIEAVTGKPVDRRFYLAGSYLCQQALLSGRIDGYVEYSGTALTAILKQPLPPVGQRDEATVFQRVRTLYASRYRIKVEPGLGFQNTFAMVVRGDDARRHVLKTISDAVTNSPTANGWRLGVGYEFQSRPDGLSGLMQTYGLKLDGSPRTMDLGLLYRALSSRQVDMVAGNSTDGPIRALGFVVLEDDKNYFPPYEAVPLFREDSLRRHPGIQEAMDRLAGKVSADEVRAMNYAVDSEHKDVGDVVREFRRGKGL